MRPTVFALSLALICAASTTFAASKRPFSGNDFSGVYECKGNDSHEGPYTSTVTLQLVKEQS
jgi:hypothetical protein